MRPFSQEHFQATRNALAEHGVEATPDEVKSMISEVLDEIRVRLRAKGIPVPDDDEELCRILKAIGF
jgi:hypothetical protein